ncbi:transposable element Tcb2 transposase [Trichonephila clavipes]|nr:transposable element Tcb2 transposase [Trichonephila clavipes]
MSLYHFRRQYEQLSQFERRSIIGMLEVVWSARPLARQLCRSDCVVRKCGNQCIRGMSFTGRQGSGRSRQTSRQEDRHIGPLCFLEPYEGAWLKDIWDRGAHYVPLTPTHDCLHLEWCRARGNWTAAEWNQIVFSNESRLNLSSDDNRVRVGRSRGKRLNPAFALQRHTTPTACVVVWGAIAYNTRPPLVLIRGTMTAQRYVHDILQLHVLPLMQRLPGTLFQKGNIRPHTARVSQDCLRTVAILPWPAQSSDLSPIEHIWDHLGRRVGHPTSLNELEARLQQIWNEMSQDIIQNLYVSMPNRIASCIRARRGSTGYPLFFCPFL